jgi:methylmalonyl-CoA/ethylmalonyl-CoA epimerase
MPSRSGRVEGWNGSLSILNTKESHMNGWLKIVGAGVVGVVVGSAVTARLQGQASDPLAGKLSHIAVVVNNVDETAKNLADMFGVQVPEARVFRGVKYPASYGDGKATMNGKFITIPINGVSFELIEPLDGESPWKDYLLRQGEGVHHIGFTVANAQAARKVLESKGGRQTQDYADWASYIDMHPRFPITFEMVSPQPPVPAQ